VFYNSSFGVHIRAKLKIPSFTYLRHSGARRNPDTTQAEIMEFGIVDASEVLKP
jgi:hypothetical protein